jgi:predicted RNase H-like HicB family nuclease
MNTQKTVSVEGLNSAGFINPNGYLVVIETTKNGFSAYCPDLDGCITVGKTLQQTKKNMQEAIELYIEELLEMGAKLPEQKNIIEQINALGNSPDIYLTFIHVFGNGMYAKTA